MSVGIIRKNNAYIYCSDRNNGHSSAPFASLNIGLHVGDNVSDVLRNREKLNDLIRQESNIADHRKWVFLNQTHEPNIFIAAEGNYDPLNPPTADASITRSKNLPLVIMTADCGGLVLAGDTTLAAIHASWKTIHTGLIKKTIAAVKEITDEKLSAYLGPCIHPQNYEFEESLLKEIAQDIGEHVISKTKDNKPAFDLPAAIKDECNKFEIEVEELGVDTYESKDHFSYRRDHITGRQGVIAWLK